MSWPLLSTVQPAGRLRLGAEHGDVDGGLDRVVLFSDAVFAIVITLLILPLVTEAEPAGADVAAAVAALWPRLVAFVVSFLVIGQFWVAHHRLFRMVRDYDLPTMWLNLLVMLGVTFVPVPTALLGGHATDRFADGLYAATLAVVSLLFGVLWGYVRSAGHVVADPGDVRLFTVRTVVTTLLFVCGVLVAVQLPYIATLTWLACLPLLRTLLTARIVRYR